MELATGSPPRTRFRHSLGFRIVIACALLGAGLSGAFAVAVYVATDMFEDQLVALLLRDELDAFMALAREEGAATIDRHFSARLRGYIAPEAEASSLPAWLADLSDGVHDARGPDGQDYHVLVTRTGGLRQILTQEVSEFETRQRQLAVVLGAGALAAGYLSIWIGWLVSRRVTTPLRVLSAMVASLPADRAAGRLRDGFADDEVGQLAGALDLYRERLHVALERERDFTADASHELRTPLAVILGAVEVLQENCRHDDHQRQRLERIHRACLEMQDLIEVFLFLGRQPSRLKVEECRLLDSVEKAVMSEQAAITASRRVSAHVSPEVVVAAPGRAVEVLVSNLVRNAVRYTRGPVEILVEGTRLYVRDAGGDVPAGDPRVSGEPLSSPTAATGRGLAIVRRICRHYGWGFDIELSPALGSNASIDFGSALTKS